MNSVTLPPESDQFVLAYQRLFNNNARTDDLQHERIELRQRFGELLRDCKSHFAKCDQVRIEQLLVEREAVTEDAKLVLADIRQLQQKSGQFTSAQARLHADLQQAQERLNAFRPVNRTIATLQQIEENKAEEIELKKVVHAAKTAINNNQLRIMDDSALRELSGRYRELAAQEESISRELEELQKPPEQRKQRSSIVWEDAGNVFSLQLP